MQCQNHDPHGLHAKSSIYKDRCNLHYCTWWKIKEGGTQAVLHLMRSSSHNTVLGQELRHGC